MVGKILFVSLLLSSVAFALTDEEKTERARIHLKAAIAYYDDGRYEDAAREMNAAYGLRPLPDLQYNLAQCYERLNRLEDAAKSYENYLAAKVDAPDRKNVQARIDNLRERAKAEASGQSVPAAPPQEKVVFKTIVVYKEAPPPPGRAARWAAYGLFVLGAAGIATGIAYAVLASQAADTVSVSGNVASPPTFDGKVRDTQESGQAYPVVEAVGFTVGAVAIAAGAALFVVGNKIDKEAAKREKEQAFRIAPSFARDGGGLVVAGRF